MGLFKYQVLGIKYKFLRKEKGEQRKSKKSKKEKMTSRKS